MTIKIPTWLRHSDNQSVLVLFWFLHEVQMKYPSNNKTGYSFMIYKDDVHKILNSDSWPIDLLPNLKAVHSAVNCFSSGDCYVISAWRVRQRYFIDKVIDEERCLKIVAHLKTRLAEGVLEKTKDGFETIEINRLG